MTSEQTPPTLLSEVELETALEDAFESIMSDYSMDVEGSIEDMLFEFFSSGFLAALDGLEEEEEEE